MSSHTCWCHRLPVEGDGELREKLEQRVSFEEDPGRGGYEGVAFLYGYYDIWASEKIRRHTHGLDESGCTTLDSRCQGESRRILGESGGTVAVAAQMG